MNKYYLKQDTYLCMCQNHWIFLDLGGDKYHQLSLDESKLLGHVIDLNHDDLGPNSRKANIHPRKDEIDRLKNSLLSSNLVVNNAADGKEYEPLSSTTPTRDFIGHDFINLNKAPISNIAKFSQSVITSYIRLKYLPLIKTIDHVKYLYHQSRINNRFDGSIEGLKKLVDQYNTLRPFLFTAKNQCLYDSLVLSKFLLMNHITPQWIFGVKMDPFSAHCWLQLDDIVLNDSVMHTSLHTPIMAL